MKKIFLIAVIFFCAIATGCGSTPKTIEQFITNYNKEIKNTAGARVERDGGYSILISRCTIKEITTAPNGSKVAQLYSSGDEAAFVANEHPKSFDVTFAMNKSISSDAIFSIIEAAILATGDDYNDVTKSLGILSGNQYNIPAEFNKEISFNKKKYKLGSMGDFIFFSVVITK